MGKLNQTGFTLIELLLAMTVFSAVLVISTVGFIGMNRSYSKGVIRKDLSEATQLVAEDITRAIRAEGISSTIEPCSTNELANPTNDNCAPGWSATCTSTAHYFWKSSGTNTGLYKDSESCTTANSAAAKPMLGDRFKVQALEIEKLAQPAGLFRIKGVFTTREGYATPDGNPYNIACQGSAENPASRSCAVEKFNFIVSARGTN